jgi:signal transduction histidine kinase
VRVVAERLKITAVNTEALEMFGAANRQMLDACTEELVRDEAGALFRSLFRAIHRGDEHAKLEGTVYRIDGGEIHVVLALVAPDPSSSTVTLAWSDLTGHQERMAAEQQAQQQTKELERVNKDVERLFRAVSHDLRAPLRAVQNLADWALEDLQEGTGEDVPKHLIALRSRSVRLEQMLTDLLSYARVGRAEHAFESVDVGELLVEVRGMVELPSGIELRWSPSMPIVVTQRTLLSQVFLNLIGNAIKHHDQDTGIIEVTACNSACVTTDRAFQRSIAPRSSVCSRH